MPIPRPSLTNIKCPGCNEYLRLLNESENLYVCSKQAVLWKILMDNKGGLIKKIYSPDDYAGPSEYRFKTAEK
jgi:hypothetical protein